MWREYARKGPGAVKKIGFNSHLASKLADQEGKSNHPLQYGRYTASRDGPITCLCRRCQVGEGVSLKTKEK
jgi:hypothetical protein